MKILHITNLYPTEKNCAYGIFVKEQIESLEALGVECEVCFINAREKGDWQYVLSAPRIRRMVKQCDLVHCHHAYSGMAYLMATWNCRPMVFSNLGDIHKQRREIDRKFFRIVAHAAKAVIYKNDMKVDDPDGKYHYLPNGVNTEFFKPGDRVEARRRLGLDAEKTYVLFVTSSGTQARSKRYDRFCSVMERMAHRGIACEPVVMTGVERDLTPYYYNACNALLVTSDNEGSPNMVKEAMACDLPVVSTDVGNVRRMLDGCHASFVADTPDVDLLANLLESALQCPDRNGRDQIFSKQLDMESVANKLAGLYRQVLQQG